MARLRTFLILLLVGAGVALSLSSGCMTDPVTGKRSLGLVNPSDDEEVLEGRQYAPSFVAEYDGLYPDRAASDYLAGIVRRIGALSHRPSLPYRFTLLNPSSTATIAASNSTNPLASPVSQPPGVLSASSGLLCAINTQLL